MSSIYKNYRKSRSTEQNRNRVKREKKKCEHFKLFRFVIENRGGKSMCAHKMKDRMVCRTNMHTSIRMKSQPLARIYQIELPRERKREKKLIVFHDTIELNRR